MMHCSKLERLNLKIKNMDNSNILGAKTKIELPRNGIQNIEFQTMVALVLTIVHSRFQ